MFESREFLTEDDDIKYIKLDIDHYEARDLLGRFICSGYSLEEVKREAQEHKEAMNKKKIFVVTYSAAKSRWITKNDKRLQVPVEEFRRFRKLVNAKTEQEAVKRIEKPGHIIVNASAQVV